MFLRMELEWSSKKKKNEALSMYGDCARDTGHTAFFLDDFVKTGASLGRKHPSAAWRVPLTHSVEVANQN